MSTKPIYFVRFKTNTMILHGFNSGRGNREKIAAQYIVENNIVTISISN